MNTFTKQEIRRRRRTALRGAIDANDRHRATRGGPDGHEEKFFWGELARACHREVQRMNRIEKRL
ncbi:hypothetical protein [Alcanivorax sp.]|uniref:hypothetical protein n=1 Tax=Alcanivorax sp. TaxID=1872427 RepID=UPI000C10B442|nr:hypothetical protein [Alcanivorax sp.]PHR68479.1 MAG: hypothetical protein COA55_00215 [Alcanivorax sp.]